MRRLSRIPVQRPGLRRCGWAGPGRPAAAPGAGGRQLLLPAPLRPADVHHALAVQQEDRHQQQGQGDGGGQGRLPVSILCYYLLIFSGLNPCWTDLCGGSIAAHKSGAPPRLKAAEDGATRRLSEVISVCLDEKRRLVSASTVGTPSTAAPPPFRPQYVSDYVFLTATSFHAVSAVSICMLVHVCL